MIGVDYTLLYYLAGASFVMGVVCGAVYDILRIIRAFGKTNRFLVFFEDFLYCLFVSLVLAVLYYNYSNGQVRLYAVLCLAVGFSAYYFTLGKLTHGICIKIRAFLSKTAKALRKKAKKIMLSSYASLYCKRYIKTKVSFAKRGFGL